MPPRPNRVSKRTNKPKPPTPTPTPASTTTTEDPNGPIYFWKPQEAETGYLSQWYNLPFRDRETTTTTNSNNNGKIYATAEHYMMHHKALLFNDAEIATAILEAASPRDVKALGRAVRGFDEVTWARERERIVTEGNWCKFSLPVIPPSPSSSPSSPSQIEKQDVGGDGLKTWALGEGASAQTVRARSFRDVLLATGDRELVEASPLDRIWGIGFGAKNAGAKRAKWGRNLLGKCLMDVREQFRREAEIEAEDESGGGDEGEGGTVKVGGDGSEREGLES